MFGRIVMTVDGANFLSPLSGSTDLEGAQQAMLKDGSVTSGFADAMLEQIKLLQEQGDIEKIKDLKETNAFNMLAAALPKVENQQNLAALSGTSLPHVNNIKKGVDDIIDLEKTIDILHDAMEHLTEATAFIDKVSATVTDAIEDVVTQFEADLATHQSTKPELLTEDALLTNADVTETAVLADMMKQAVVANDFTNPLLPEEESVESALPAVSGVLGQKQGKAIIPGKTTDSLLEQVAKVDGPIVDDTKNAMADELLKPDSSPRKFAMENNLVDTKPMDNVFEKSLPVSGENLDKILPKVAGEFVQFNRQVITETKTEISTMSRNLAEPEWKQELGEKILWMHSKSVQVAEIRLNPQHLGPVSIRVDVTQDQAIIDFTAQHAAVREAIDAALPRLREMLNNQQLNLAEVNISQQSFAEQQQHQEQRFTQGNSDQQSQSEQTVLANSNSEQDDNGPMDIGDEIEQSRTIASHGLLNTYA